jgi:acyl-CoA hydrolase/GNAT superfamily N-acetyltransferase
MGSIRKWEEKIVTPDRVVQKIKPGMSIFIGTGSAEPRTLVKTLMNRDFGNLQDLELIQIVSLGEAASLKTIRSQKYRLKTFFPGWIAHDAIVEGQVDLVPSRFARIPQLFESGLIPVNVAMVQVSPPDETGNCSLGIAVDVARQAMEKATLVIGEINARIPRTFGDTFVHVSDFDNFILSSDPPLYFNRWPLDPVFDQVAANVATLIEDGSCISYSIGSLFEALSCHLSKKKNLGVHSPFVTDALMDLINSGAVSNRQKEIYRGKSLVSYALGTPELLAWLDRNPLVEFQGIDKVFNFAQIGRNPRFVAVIHPRRIDLFGRIALQVGKGNIATGPAEVMDLVNGAEISDGGRTIFALPSRNSKGHPNILLSVKNDENLFRLHEAVDLIVTEYGTARIQGYTVRERAQALIDLAHPDDRPDLIRQAKMENILYPDQIFLPESARLYPGDVHYEQTFKGGLKVSFRPIKPSDEEEMRRLFYRFSDDAVYYRYFGHVKTMPHARMQEYVNVDWARAMSIVGLVESDGQSRIIAEARYIRETKGALAEVVFVVDEDYQGRGIATYLYKILVELAKERGLKGFTADVLFSNQGMMKVFRKGGWPIKAELENGIYQLTVEFYPQQMRRVELRVAHDRRQP